MMKNMINVPVDGCTISGALALVLRVSQIYGVAAITVKKENEGWRIRASTRAKVWERILVPILTVSTIILRYLYYQLDEQTIYIDSTTSRVILRTIEVWRVPAVLFTQAYSVGRMDSVIICLAQLKKIKENLKTREPHNRTEKNKFKTVIWSLCIGHIVVYVQYFYEIYNISNRHTCQSIVYISYITVSYVMVLMLNALILQMTLLFLDVHSSFNQLNDCLDTLLQQMDHFRLALPPSSLNQEYIRDKISPNKINKVIDTIFNEGKYPQYPVTSTLQCDKAEINKLSIEIPATLHYFNYVYCCLCEIVKILNNSHDMVLLTFTLHCLLNLVITPYNFLGKIFGTNAGYEVVITEGIWLIFHVTNMFMIVDACHQTSAEMHRTKKIISQMFRACSLEDAEIIKELHIFCKELGQNYAYRPLNMFKIDRKLITQILGSSVIYLVAIVQL